MNRSSIIALGIFAAILAYFLSFGAESTRKLQAGFYSLVSPFLKTGSGIQKSISSVSTGLKTLEEVERDNAALRVDNRALKATNQALRDVEHEVNRLRRALAYRERSVFKLVPAEIVARDSSTWWRTVTINRGKNDRIESDMPVVTDAGLVGKTTTVGDNISIVLLISDENCKVATSVEGTREQGIVSGERVTGSVTPLLDLNFLSKQANLQPGMKTYTSGVGGVFPSGLLIGTVQSFKARELDGQARITPAVDLSHLEDVFVVTGEQMIFFVVLLVLTFVAQIVEFFIPPLDWMYNARIYIVPVIVFYGAMALPFPLVLALAAFAGFLLDAVTVQVVTVQAVPRVEISVGWSILLYAVLAAIMHGLRPLFVRGRWEVHCIMSGLCTSAILLSQYLMIAFRRGSLVFTREAWWQIGGPGVVAMLMAPLAFWILHSLGRLTANPYLPEEDSYK